MNDETEITGFYRHWKGGLYLVFGTCTNTETGEKSAIYQKVESLISPPAIGNLWNREISNFQDTVTNEEGVEVSRFRKLSEAEMTEEFAKAGIIIGDNNACQCGGDQCQCQPESSPC